MKKDTEQAHGALLINKEAGMTSFDVLRHLKRNLVQEAPGMKWGHSGTLDPFATGLLIILLGHATRLQDELHLLPKTYRTTITLGATSDTDDSTGVITTRISDKPSKDRILEVLARIQNRTTQIPPDYAAIKIQGQKMYTLARAGKTIAKKPRPITIHEMQMEKYTYPSLTISVICSTGTYIRAIARDIGDELGSGAYCTTLERTAIGPFTVKNAWKLQDLSNDIREGIIPIEQLVSHLPRVKVSEENVAKLKNGREVEDSKNAPTNTPLALIDSNNKLFGIGIRKTGTLFITSRKIFLR